MSLSQWADIGRAEHFKGMPSVRLLQRVVHAIGAREAMVSERAATGSAQSPDATRDAVNQTDSRLVHVEGPRTLAHLYQGARSWSRKAG